MTGYTEEASSRPMPGSGRWGWGWIWVFSLAPAMVLAPWILRTWVSFPYHDDWGTPGHQLVLLCQEKLTLREMFAQHNESRPFFARLLLIPLAWFGGWDARKVICAIFGLVCLASYLLHCLVRRMAGITWVGVFGLSLVVNLVLFWPNSEIWTYANNLMLVFPPVALLGAVLVNLSGMPLRDKVIWTSVLGTVSTYWWANGMVLWVLGAPLARGVLVREAAGAKDEGRVKWYLIYGAVALVNIAFYFHGYKRPADSPPIAWDLGQICSYFFTWLGAPFEDESKARTLGFCVFLIYLAMGWLAVSRSYRRRDFTGCYPWLTLGKYAILSGVVAALGRSGFGDSQAMSPRYTAVSGYLYIALAGLAGLMWSRFREHLQPGRVRLAGFIGGVAALLCVPFLAQSYGRGIDLLTNIGEHREALLVAWQWSKAIPNSPELELILPNVEILKEFGDVLEEHQVLQVTRFDPAIMARWSYAAKATDATNGVFNSCAITPDGWLDVSGWARLPDGGGAADCVLLTVSEAGSEPRPLAMLPGDLASPDIAAALKDETMGRNGFRMVAPMDGEPKGRVTIAAWAVDLKKSVIRPIAHRFIMDAH